MSKLERYLLFGGFTTAVVILGLFAFWALFPYNPVDFDRPTLEILNCPCEPGDEVWYRISGTNNGSYYVTISKSLVNGHIITFEPIYELAADGDFDFTASVRLPESHEVGLTKIRVGMEFHTNPLSHTYELIESDYFEVVEPGTGNYGE